MCAVISGCECKNIDLTHIVFTRANESPRHCPQDNHIVIFNFQGLRKKKENFEKHSPQFVRHVFILISRHHQHSPRVKLRVHAIQINHLEHHDFCRKIITFINLKLFSRHYPGKPKGSHNGMWYKINSQTAWKNGSRRSLSITQICHFIVGLVEEFTFACLFSRTLAGSSFALYDVRISVPLCHGPPFTMMKSRSCVPTSAAASLPSSYHEHKVEHYRQQKARFVRMGEHL